MIPSLSTIWIQVGLNGLHMHHISLNSHFGFSYGGGGWYILGHCRLCEWDIHVIHHNTNGRYLFHSFSLHLYIKETKKSTVVKKSIPLHTPVRLKFIMFLLSSFYDLQHNVHQKVSEVLLSFYILNFWNQIYIGIN